MRFMQFDLMKKAALGSVVFSFVAMGTIIFISTGGIENFVNRKQAVEQETENAVQEPSEETESDAGKGALTFVLGESDTSYLRIPLPEGCQAEDITIENHYMVQELYVVIKNGADEFYAENPISGNREMITQGRYEADGGQTRLQFDLTGIFEYHTILENNDLYIRFVSPREMYDKVVVIDPACGGTNEGEIAQGLKEKEINLQIAEKLKEKLDKTGIKAYYTRMDDINPDEDARVKLANETRADMYIRIQTDASEDDAVYGISSVYNGDFFIPGFGSMELAELLADEVTESVKGKSLGTKPAETKAYAIRQITIPAAAINVGCITNPQEAILLKREEYQEKIADGIYQAVIQAYEGLK